MRPKSECPTATAAALPFAGPATPIWTTAPAIERATRPTSVILNAMRGLPFVETSVVSEDSGRGRIFPEPFGNSPCTLRNSRVNTGEVVTGSNLQRLRRFDLDGPTDKHERALADQDLS